MPPQLRSLIAATLNVDESLVTDEASMQTLEKWDSLAHMNLIAALESNYSVRFEPEDLLTMVSAPDICAAITRLGVSLG